MRIRFDNLNYSTSPAAAGKKGLIYTYKNPEVTILNQRFLSLKINGLLILGLKADRYSHLNIQFHPE